MTRLLAVLMVLALASPAIAAPVRDDFANYPAKPYTGLRHPPVFSGASRSWYDFRTRLRWGFAHDRAFAGHYVITGFGCGTGCSVNVMGDLTNGQIIAFPISGEEYYESWLEFRPSSRLVRAYWVPIGADGIPEDRCLVANLVWTGSAFKRGAARPISGECHGPLYR